MTYDPERFSMQLATSPDYPRLVNLYNDKIEEVQRSNEEQLEAVQSSDTYRLGWKPFSVHSLRLYAKQRRIYKVSPNDSTGGLPEICAAVMVDDIHDNWPPHMGWLDEGTARFTKFVAATGLAGFGRQVAWPLLQETARAAGYTELYCEVRHPNPKLHNYYRSLGMEETSSPLLHRSWEYEEGVIVQPLILSLPPKGTY